ncbi:MAG TPA: serine hydrolase domain-containing protein [Vicinamibacterales bacterium]|nr:serine hydrolase domain-containing protein [Vicinamibacterales bacterium]
MRAMIDAGRTPGVAVAVAIDGRIVWTEGFGFANLELQVPATAETMFGIGSISKSLTVTATARLADRGLIDLDAPIERDVPDFPQAGRGVTIRRIAVHQSGLSDQFATDHYETTRNFPTVTSADEAMRGAALEYAPGTKSVYATGVFTFLGRALEGATGKPYLEVMRDEVFGPAGLAFVPNDRRAAAR